MNRIADCRLYGILDLGYVAPADAAPVAEKMLEGGVDVLQLRAKHYIEKDIMWFVEQIHPLTRAAGVPLIINDSPEICAEVAAEGVHLGQDDLPMEEARALVGPRALLGKSTHSLAQATAAASEGADYLGFGPLFPTPTKPGYAAIGLEEIRRVHELVRIPIFCIGGIKLENLASVLAAGAERLVIVSGILQAADIVSYTRAAKAIILQNPLPKN